MSVESSGPQERVGSRHHRGRRTRRRRLRKKLRDPRVRIVASVCAVAGACLIVAAVFAGWRIGFGIGAFLLGAGAYVAVRE